MTLSKTQIDHLGNRLRSSAPTHDDLVALEEFRLSFEPAYQYVVEKLRELKLEPTGRPAKSTESTIAKLKRESTRLSQIQDIAGCRVVVDSVAQQDRVSDEMQAIFPRAVVFDRRSRSSHGYRAVHFVIYASGMPVEVQLRTTLQHSWAEISEKLADILDPMIKYGGGPASIRIALNNLSQLVESEEEAEQTLRRLREADSDGQQEPMLQKKEEELRRRKLRLHESCRELMIRFEAVMKTL